MKPILEDFVNRSDQLTLLWQIARQQTDPRILVVEAEGGMGKTYLLKEFRAECREERLEVVYLDFNDRYEDPGYMYVIKEAWSQLGPFGFDSLAKMIDEIVSGNIKKNGQTGWQDFQAERQVTRVPARAILNQPFDAMEAGSGQSGGVNIYGGSHTFRDIAGRDLVHLTQVIYHEPPFVQTQARNWITEAFKQCLVQITAERSIVFFIDHWQKAESELHHWLANSLIKWTADGLLARACIVVAGEERVGLEPRRLLKRILLPELAEDAVQLYLVNICGLPAEEVPNFIRVAGGIPYLLNMGVKRWQREKRQR
jgi:hypothetical protein